MRLSPLRTTWGKAKFLATPLASDNLCFKFQDWLSGKLVKSWPWLGLVLGAAVGILILAVADLAAAKYPTFVDWLFIRLHTPALVFVLFMVRIPLWENFSVERAIPYAIVTQWALGGLLFGWWVGRKRARTSCGSKMSKGPKEI